MCKETDFSGNKQSAVAQVRKKMRHTQFKMCMDCAQQLKYQMERMKRHPLHNILCVILWERHYSRLFSLQKWGGNTLGQYSNPIIIYVEEYINMPWTNALKNIRQGKFTGVMIASLNPDTKDFIFHKTAIVDNNTYYAAQNKLSDEIKVVGSINDTLKTI